LSAAGRKRKVERDGWAGGGASWAAWAEGARAGEEGWRPVLLAGSEKENEKEKRVERRKVGWAEREKGRGEKGFGIFLNSFQIYFSNFTQTIKPCIRIMMHKHLLFLTLLK
jgi:hypothetical protein